MVLGPARTVSRPIQDNRDIGGIDLELHRTDLVDLPKAAVEMTQIAVLIPCLNEALTIASVVREFRRELPEAQVYVFDNGSTDGSAEIAAGAGAIVRHVAGRGKGNVVRAMFREVDADVYVMVD